MVHLDICGPIKIVSLRGSRYFPILTDDYSDKIGLHVKEKEINFKYIERIKEFN